MFKNILLVVGLMFSLLGCNKDLSNSKILLDKGNLFEVDSVWVRGQTPFLDIVIQDDSYIFFEDYLTLKSDVFIHKNYSKLTQTDSIQVTFTKGEPPRLFTVNYTRANIDSIHNQYKSNPYLEHNIESAVSLFNASEIYNLRAQVLGVSESVGDAKPIGFFELLKRYAKDQNSQQNITQTVTHDRMIFIRDMFIEIGIEDIWTEQQKPAPELVKKLNALLGQ